MKALVLGTADDVRGFALAGVRGRVCASAEDLRTAAASVEDGEVGLVILSPGLRLLAPEVFDSLAARRQAPFAVVLP